jgi:hypothetical protein
VFLSRGLPSQLEERTPLKSRIFPKESSSLKSIRLKECFDTSN